MRELLAARERDDWIVRADLPARHVEFAQRSTGRSVPTSITTTGDRDRRLVELLEYLSSVLAVKPVLLRAAGAISVTASQEELSRISSHPLIKRIEPNRRRRP